MYTCPHVFLTRDQDVMVLILSLAWRTLLLMSPIALPSETIGLCCGYGVQPDLLGVFNQKLCSFLRLFCFRVLPFILPLVLSRLALPSLSFGLRSLLRSLLLRLRSLPLEMVINGQTFILESFQTTYIAWYMYMYFTVHMIYIYTTSRCKLPKKHCLGFLRVFAFGLPLLLLL